MELKSPIKMTPFMSILQDSPRLSMNLSSNVNINLLFDPAEERRRSKSHRIPEPDPLNRSIIKVSCPPATKPKPRFRDSFLSRYKTITILFY